MAEKQAELLTTEELAELLDMKVHTVKRLRQEGAIPAVIISERIIRYDRDEVIAALKKRSEENQKAASR